MRQSRSHYELLGVTPHASHDEIRRAYRAMAQQHHPDTNPDSSGDRPEGDRLAMADINAAWEVLGDPEKRREYDWAIGTTPRPTTYVAEGDDPAGAGDDEDDLGSDEPYVAAPRRPSDMLVVIPVFMAIAAVATFVFSTMSESELLRTVAILMAPVTIGAFIAAPLFVMLRARGRGER